MSLHNILSFFSKQKVLIFFRFSAIHSHKLSELVTLCFYCLKYILCVLHFLSLFHYLSRKFKLFLFDCKYTFHCYSYFLKNVLVAHFFNSCYFWHWSVKTPIFRFKFVHPWEIVQNSLPYRMLDIALQLISLLFVSHVLILCLFSGKHLSPFLWATNLMSSKIHIYSSLFIKEVKHLRKKSDDQ